MSDSEIAVLHLVELRKKMPPFVMPATEGPPICSENGWRCMVNSRVDALSDASADTKKQQYVMRAICVGK
jgi:hypothetical protein